MPFCHAIDSKFDLISPTNLGATLHKRVRTHKLPSFRRAAVSIDIGSILLVGKAGYVSVRLKRLRLFLMCLMIAESLSGHWSARLWR